MKKLLTLTLSVAAITALPVGAEVNPKIHKLCLEARDYQGCVQAMSQSNNVEIKSIKVIEGRSNVSGNMCPINMAYAGGGKCIEVVCREQRGGHNPDLSNKNWICKKRIMFTMTTLGWGEASTKATYDPSCPNTQPKIGFTNSCNGEATESMKKVAPYKR